MPARYRGRRSGSREITAHRRVRPVARSRGARFSEVAVWPTGTGSRSGPSPRRFARRAGILERDSTEFALQKLSALSGDAEAEARVASAIGLSPTPYPGEELVWGARKLLEALARPRPLLVLFEDVHWAEQTFLELIEHLVESVGRRCLLIMCTTRHELIERLPEWSTAPGSDANRARTAHGGRGKRCRRASARQSGPRRARPLPRSSRQRREIRCSSSSSSRC